VKISGWHNWKRVYGFPMELNQRAREVLFALVQSYIQTGGAVCSKTVARKSGLNLSAATIRNILAKLDEQGYLTQPHPSAGRVPTDRGYRFYVDSLMERLGLPDEEIGRIARRYRLRKGSRGKEPDSLLKETSRILSEVSQYIGMVMSPRISDVRYNHMEFIRMGKREILVILVSESGFVHSCTIFPELSLTQAELDELTRILNTQLCGLTLVEVRERIVRKMRDDMYGYRKLLEKVFMTNLFSGSQSVYSQIYLQGTSNILNCSDFADDLEKMKKLFETFEQKNRLIQLLDRSMQSTGVLVYIGSENPLRWLEDCSLVTATYRCNNNVMGSLGVMGPKRMDYSKVIPVVESTAKLLSNFLRGSSLR